MVAGESAALGRKKKTEEESETETYPNCGFPSNGLDGPEVGVNVGVDVQLVLRRGARAVAPPVVVAVRMPVVIAVSVCMCASVLLASVVLLPLAVRHPVESVRLDVVVILVLVLVFFGFDRIFRVPIPVGSEASCRGRASCSQRDTPPTTPRIRGHGKRRRRKSSGRYWRNFGRASLKMHPALVAETARRETNTGLWKVCRARNAPLLPPNTRGRSDSERPLVDEMSPNPPRRLTAPFPAPEPLAGVKLLRMTTYTMYSARS